MGGEKGAEQAALPGGKYARHNASGVGTRAVRLNGLHAANDDKCLRDAARDAH